MGSATYHMSSHFSYSQAGPKDHKLHALNPLKFCSIAGSPGSISSLQQNLATGLESSSVKRQNFPAVAQRWLALREEPQVRHKPFSRVARDRNLSFWAHQWCRRRPLHSCSNSKNPRQTRPRHTIQYLPPSRRRGRRRPHPCRHGVRALLSPVPSGPAGTPRAAPRGRGRPPRGGEAGHDSWLLSARRLAPQRGAAAAGGSGSGGGRNSGADTPHPVSMIWGGGGGGTPAARGPPRANRSA